MDDLLGRRTPQNNEAEQAVIGSMILDSRCIPDVIEVLRADDFYLAENRDIFETIHSMFSMSQPIDPLTLVDRMQARGVYSDATKRYIGQLMEITPTVAHVRFYADIVRDKSLLRQVVAAATDISGMAYEGETEATMILDSAEQRLFDIRQGRTVQEFKNVGEIMIDVYDRLNELAKNKGKLPGLPTGFGELDNITTGLNKSDLIIIAARPGVGKTSLALNMMLNAAKREPGGTAVYFSLEMSREQLVTRLLSSESFVDSNKLLTGNLEPEDWAEIAPAAERLSRMNLLIDDNPAITPAEMKAKCRRVKGLSLIMIDYLQLMSSGAKRNDNRAQEVSEISRSMKIMAKDLQVPLVCLSQLSRESEKGGEGPKLSHLRESGAIEQDADIIMFLYKDPSASDGEPSDTYICNVAKNRHGKTGIVELMWHAQYTTFQSLDRKHDAPRY